MQLYAMVHGHYSQIKRHVHDNMAASTLTILMKIVFQTISLCL